MKKINSVAIFILAKDIKINKNKSKTEISVIKLKKTKKKIVH